MNALRFDADKASLPTTSMSTAIKTVSLVATEEITKKFFPDSPGPRPGFKPGILRAGFSIIPSHCETKLGQWLANEVTTTEREDDASRVKILIPATDAGAMLTNLGLAISGQHQASLSLSGFGYKQTDHVDFGRKLAAVRHELDKIEDEVMAFGDRAFKLRVVEFEWPVFGSKAGGIDEGVDTPEKFFDHCAHSIRKTGGGGVLLSAGLSKTRPPESLLRTMCNGRGLELIAAYDKQREENMSWRTQ